MSSTLYVQLNNTELFELIADIINQGIDGYLQAVITERIGNDIYIQDSDSLKCFLRRCEESQKDELRDMASSIMYTLDYEWI